MFSFVCHCVYVECAFLSVRLFVYFVSLFAWLCACLFVCLCVSLVVCSSVRLCVCLVALFVC